MKENAPITVLDAECSIDGTLQIDRDLVMKGRVAGLLRVGGTLELTETAMVSGTIIAGRIRVGGRIDADIIADHAVELLPMASVSGRIFTPSLAVAAGARLTSTLHVNASAVKAGYEYLEEIHRDEAEGDTDGPQTAPVEVGSDIPHEEEKTRREATPLPDMPRTSLGRSVLEIAADDAPVHAASAREIEEVADAQAQVIARAQAARKKIAQHARPSETGPNTVSQNLSASLKQRPTRVIRPSRAQSA